MFIQAIYIANEKERPKAGWLLFQKTETGELIPLISARERQIKVTTLDQVLVEVQKKFPNLLNTIKIEYITDKGLIYGTLFCDPSRSLKGECRENSSK